MGDNIVVPREVRPGPRSYAAWATNISAGPASEAGQHLTATVALLPLQPGDPKALEFDVPPTIDLATGDLRFTIKHRIYPSDGHPDDRAFDMWYSSAGLARVRVTLQDDGGTAGSGQDSSSADFTIFLDPVPIARDLNIKHPWKADCIPLTLTAFDTDTAPKTSPDFEPRVSPYPWPKLEILSYPRNGYLEYESDGYYGGGMSPITPAHQAGGLSINYAFTLCYTPLSSTFIGFDTFNYRVIDPDGNVSAPATVDMEIFEN